MALGWAACVKNTFIHVCAKDGSAFGSSPLRNDDCSACSPRNVGPRASSAEPLGRLSRRSVDPETLVLVSLGDLSKFMKQFPESPPGTPVKLLGNKTGKMHDSIVRSWTTRVHSPASMSTSWASSSESDPDELGFDFDEPRHMGHSPLPKLPLFPAPKKETHHPPTTEKCFGSATRGSAAESVQELLNTCSDKQPTTLMVRNIPNRYSQADFVSEVDYLGFTGTYDFLYLPSARNTRSNVGYAFINFIDSNWAMTAMKAFRNYRFNKAYTSPGGGGKKIATVSVADIQGMELNLQHHQSVVVIKKNDNQNRPLVLEEKYRSMKL